MEKHNIKIEVKAVPCPECGEGHLLPFLKAVSTRGVKYGRGIDTEFDHYEVYFECSKCHARFESVP